VVVVAVTAAFGLKRLDARAPVAETGVRLAPNGIDPAPLPEFIGTEWIGQRVDVTPAEREVLPPDTGYSRRNYVSVQDRSRQVFVSIVLSGRDRSSIHRPELCVVGQGWNIVDRTEQTLRVGPGDELPVTLLRIQRELSGRGGERVTVSCWLAYWFVGRDAEMPSHAGMIWHSSLDRLLHFRADRWAYVMAQTPLANEPGGEAAGLRQIEDVLSAVWPQLRRGTH
jgi:EpsI family protein